MVKFKLGDFVRHKLSDKLFVIIHTEKYPRDGSIYYAVAPYTTHNIIKPSMRRTLHSRDVNKYFELDHSAQVLYGRNQT